MRTRRVESWNELNDALFEGSWNPQLGRFRSNRVFRGLSHADYRLETSLMRLGGDYARLEAHALRNFRKYAHRNAATGNSVWAWMALAQHHHLPTRLLDWTHSPLIAAHFATVNLDRYDRDGVVWCVDYTRVNDRLPEVLRAILREEGSQGAFTVEMLNRGADTLRAFGRLAAEPFALFLEPPSLDDRIVNQYALFSVASDPTLAMDDWLADNPDLYSKVVIPAKLKWEVRDKLDQANITERVLFPGLDGLGLWLRRHYSPAG